MDVLVTVVKKDGPVSEVAGFRLKGAGKHDAAMVQAHLLSEAELPGVTLAFRDSESLNDATDLDDLVRQVKAMVAR